MNIDKSVCDHIAQAVRYGKELVDRAREFHHVHRIERLPRNIGKMKRGKPPSVSIEHLCELRKSGMKICQIAKVVGISEQGIYQRFYTHRISARGNRDTQ
jgi:hypothetical protein